MTTETLHVKIMNQAYGGFGVARHEGRVLFVPDCIQGDEVLVKITEEKKNFAFAAVESFVQRSALRIASDCVYESSCGGCQWLTIPQERQLDFKKSFLIDALKRMGGITLLDEIHVHSSDSRYYRNRVLLRGQIHEDGHVHVGFMERASHNQVAIQHCLNVDPLINAFISFLSELKTENKAQKFRVEVQVLPASQKLVLVLHSLHGMDSLNVFKKELSAHSLVLSVSLAQEKAPLFLFERDLERDFYTSPGAFQQVNLPLNHSVRKLIKSFAEFYSIDSVLDLFCGSGNLSLALADNGRRILGLEQSDQAIRIAQKNVHENKLRNAEYVCAASHKYLRDCKETFDLVIADPPRKGMKECLNSLKKLNAKYMIYMSCDPVTLARDLKELKEVYEIGDVHLFDFFPNTYHLETVVFLKNTSHL